MSKQRRIKKLVKGHLNSKGPDGVQIYTTAQQKIDRLAVLDDIAQTNATQLLEALTGTTGGDNDGIAFAADAFPFDARESADADNDGIGDNQEIVTMYKAIQALAADVLALGAPTTAAAAAALTQLGIMETQDKNNGDNDELYDGAEAAYFAQKLIVDTNKATSDAKIVEAEALQAAIEALPLPGANVTIEALGVRSIHTAVGAAPDSLAKTEVDLLKTNAAAVDTQEALFSDPGVAGYETRRGVTVDPNDDTPA